MIGMVFLIVTGFLGVVWNAYRVGARRAADGTGYVAEGKIRWADEPRVDSSGDRDA